MLKDPRISETGVWNRKAQQKTLRKKDRANRQYGKKIQADVVEAIIPWNETIADLGASIGLLVEELRKRGYSNIFGLDGTEGIEELSAGKVYRQDLVGDCRRWQRAVDWATFFEVGEHIPEEFSAKLIDNVASIPRKGLIVTWAVNSGSRMSSAGHVNCRHPIWVISQFGYRGWMIDEKVTLGIWENTELQRRFRKRVLVFRRFEA